MNESWITSFLCVFVATAEHEMCVYSMYAANAVALLTLPCKITKALGRAT